MQAEARVLIVAKDDRLVGPLSEGLDRLGWRTTTARSVPGAIAALGNLAIEAAVIDLTSIPWRSRLKLDRPWVARASMVATPVRTSVAGS